MSALEVPRDQASELALVGSAVAHPAAARHVAELVEPADFYDVRLGRLVPVAAEIADVPCRVPVVALDEAAGLWPYTPPSSVRMRIGAIAVLADESIAYLLDLADHREFVSGSPAPWAARVIDAARRRRLMGYAGDLFNSLGLGRSLEAVAPLIASIGGYEAVAAERRRMARAA